MVARYGCKWVEKSTNSRFGISLRNKNYAVKSQRSSKTNRWVHEILFLQGKGKGQLTSKDYRPVTGRFVSKSISAIAAEIDRRCERVERFAL